MNNLKILREKAHISQSKFAAILGVTQASVSMWEAGVAMPRTDKLPEIAKILGCEIGELFEKDMA